MKVFFTAEQLKEITGWLKKLGSFEKFQKTLITQATSQNIIRILTEEEFSLHSNNEIDEGLGWPVLISVLEHLVSGVIKSHISGEIKIDKNDFLSFLKCMSEKLLLLSQSTRVLVKHCDKFPEYKELINNWHKSLTQSFVSLLKIADAYRLELNNESEAELESELEQLLVGYQKNFGNFLHYKNALQKIPGNFLEKISHSILEETAQVAADIFKELDLKSPSTKDADITVTPSHTVGGQRRSKRLPEFISRRDDIHGSHPQQNTSPRMHVLETNFNKLRYQQFLLSGHNLFLESVSSKPYIPESQKYAEDMSGVLLSQQMSLSQTYMDLMVNLPKMFSSADENDGTIRVLLEAVLKEKLPEIKKLLEQQKSQPAQAQPAQGQPVKGTASNQKVESSFSTFLCTHMSKKLAKSHPVLSDLIVELNKRGDERIVDHLGKTLSSEIEKIELKKILSDLPSEDKSEFEAICLPMLKAGLQAGLKEILASDWVKELETFLGDGFSSVGDLLKNLDGLPNILENSDDLNLKSVAKLFAGLFDGDSSDVRKGLSSSAGGTSSEISQGCMAVAIGKFLPVITRELFDDDKTANAVAGAVGGAITGFQVGGPWGAVIGAGVSIFSSYINNSKGRSSPNKQFEVMQRMAEGLALNINTYTGKCFERLDRRMVGGINALQSTLEQMSQDFRIMSGDLHDHMDGLGIFMGEGFELIVDQLNGLSRDNYIRSKALHRHIDDYAEHADGRFDRLEKVVCAAEKFLYQGIRDLHDLGNFRFDRLENILSREFSGVHHQLEFLFSKQWDLIETLYKEQGDDTASFRTQLGRVEANVSLNERLLRNLHRQTEEHFQDQRKHIRRLEIRDVKKQISLAGTDIYKDPKQAKKCLLKLVAAGADAAPKVSKNAFTDGDKSLLTQWIKTTCAYLHLLYRRPSLWQDREIQKATNKFLVKGSNYKSSLDHLPTRVPEQLKQYQELLYSFSSKMIEGYVKRLESTKLERLQLPFKKLSNGFYYEDLTEASDSNQRDCHILDVLTKDQDIFFYCKENGRVVVRRFNVDYLAMKGQGIKDSPVVFSNYLQASIIVSYDDVDVRGYEKFFGKFEGKDLISCSSEGYLIKCDKSSGRVYAWRPNTNAVKLHLDHCKGHIEGFGALVHDGKFVTVVATRASNSNKIQLTMSEWKFSGEFIRRREYSDLPITPKDLSRSQTLLQSWSRSYVVAGRFLIDPESLDVKINHNEDAICRYDRDTNRIRLVSPGKKSNDTYYDFKSDSFQPMLMPFTKNNHSDYQFWKFSDSTLSLGWPFNQVILRDRHLSLQRFVGNHSGYAVYCAPKAGKLLLIKNFDKSLLQNIQRTAARLNHNIWKEYSREFKQKWFDPSEGRIAADSRCLGDDQRLVEELYALKQGKFKQLKQDLSILAEIKGDVNFTAWVQVALNGFEQLTSGKLLKGSQHVIREIRDSTEACMRLQNTLSKMALQPLVFPTLVKALAALERMCVFQNIQPSLLQSKVRSGDSRLLHAVDKVIGAGIRPTLLIENQEDGKVKLLLSVKVFGQTFSSFLKNDRLFMSRFRGKREHEQIIVKFLHALSDCVAQLTWGQVKNDLAKQFARQPEVPLELCDGDEESMRYLCDGMQGIFQIEQSKGYRVQHKTLPSPETQPNNVGSAEKPSDGSNSGHTISRSDYLNLFNHSSSKTQRSNQGQQSTQSTSLETQSAEGYGY